MSTAPIVLAANQPATFYRGSGRLAAFRGADLPDRPEDWVASTTRRFGDERAGLTVLPDGTALVDAVAADPMTWTGSHDPDLGLLVKLLDTGQRLPLHVHPDRRFARTHLASPYGKTEAWHILDAADGAVVHLGFARDVAADELARWVAIQDVAAMLAATNRVSVKAGDSVLCPAGTPHAVGEGILMIELQEPTDFSIMLEREGFPIAADDAFVGLPEELAISCVHRGASPSDVLEHWRSPADGSLLPADADAFFRATRASAGERIDGFAVVVVTSGLGAVRGEWGSLDVARGTTIVVPYASGPSTLSGTAQAVVCRAAVSGGGSRRSRG